MATPTLAQSLRTLRTQLNQMSPLREKKHDGWIGDEKHKMRRSDHNPDVRGVVRAIDVTDDTDGKGSDLDALWLREALRQARDPRLKYVISEGEMFSAYATAHHPAWAWRPYTGDNKHRQHVHVSVWGGDRGARDGTWTLRRDLASSVPAFMSTSSTHLTQEDDVTPEEITAAVRTAVHGLLKEAASPDPTPTGRQVRDFLTRILTPSVVVGVWSAQFGSGSTRQSAAQRLAMAAATETPSPVVLDQLNDEAAGRVPISVNLEDARDPVE